MSEPAKKPGQQPESYQPKKPEMMRALEEAQIQAEKEASTMGEPIKAKFEIVKFEPRRFIDKSIYVRAVRRQRWKNCA